MKREKFLRLFMVLAFCAVAVLGVSAQDEDTDDGTDAERPVAGQPQGPRMNLFRQLGLSRDQIQRIRRLNAERRPLFQAAHQKVREANLALDAAIYADEVKEETVRSRLKDAQAAHAELQRIRSMDELAVRRILTPEQLVRFRELRARFDAARPMMRQNMPMRQRMMGPGMPAGSKDGPAVTDKKDKP